MDFDLIKKINTIAIPGILSTLLNTIFTLADEAIVGRLDVDGYTAVSISANLIYQIIGNIGVISIVFAIMFAKSIGSKDEKKCNEIYNSLITISSIIGVIIVLMSCLIGKTLLRQIYGISGSILKEAYLYLCISSFTVGLNLMCFIMSSFFKNIFKPRITLLATGISLPINFFVDYILVFGKLGFPKMRVAGAAIGTVVGVLVELSIFIIYFVKESKIKFKFCISLDVFSDAIKMFIPLLGQDIIENTLFIIIVGAIITRYSTALYASYSVIVSIITSINIIIYAYAGANMTIVGQSFSDKDKRKKCVIIPIYTSVFILIIFLPLLICSFLFPNQICGLITNQSMIITTAVSILSFAFIMNLLNIPCQVYKYALQSIGKERYTFISTGVSSVISCLCLYLFVDFFKLELLGVFCAYGILYVILNILFIKKYICALRQ